MPPTFTPTSVIRKMASEKAEGKEKQTRELSSPSIGVYIVFVVHIVVFIVYSFYIIRTHSNNILIWFTKRILGTVFLCPYNVCPK